MTRNGARGGGTLHGEHSQSGRQCKVVTFVVWRRTLTHREASDDVVRALHRACSSSQVSSAAAVTSGPDIVTCNPQALSMRPSLCIDGCPSLCINGYPLPRSWWPMPSR